MAQPCYVCSNTVVMTAATIIWCLLNYIVWINTATIAKAFKSLLIPYIFYGIQSIPFYSALQFKSYAILMQQEKTFQNASILPLLYRDNRMNLW